MTGVRVRYCLLYLLVTKKKNILNYVNVLSLQKFNINNNNKTNQFHTDLSNWWPKQFKKAEFRRSLRAFSGSWKIRTGRGLRCHFI